MKKIQKTMLVLMMVLFFTMNMANVNPIDASETEVVKLTEDLVFEGSSYMMLDLDGKVLDLNGYKIINRTKLEIVDSGSTSVHYWKYSDGNMTTIASSDSSNMVTCGGTIVNGGINSICNYGTLIISKGNIFGCANPAIVNYEDATLIMNDGAISYCGVYQQSDNSGSVLNKGTFEMKGGTIYHNENKNGSGGGISNYGTFTLTGGTIKNNKAAYGGAGVSNFNGSEFIMENGTISYNETTPNSAGVGNFGGGVSAFGKTILSGGTISHNFSDYGAGISVGGELLMSGGTISCNGGTEEDSVCGGGVHVYNDGVFKMTGGTINNNSATSGAGVYNEGSFTLEEGSISNNTAYNGGAGVINLGTFDMKGGSIVSNVASSSIAGTSGGGICNSGNISLSGGSVSLNKACNGAGVYMYEGTFEMTGGFIENNSLMENSDGYGGGVYVRGGKFTLKNGEIRNNTAFIGGGLCVDGTFEMTGGKITGNIASADNSAIYSLGVLSLLGGSITGNRKSENSQVSDDYGAVWIDDLTKLTLGGDIVISGNLNSGGQECNLYLSNYFNGGTWVSGRVPLNGADIHFTLEDNSKPFITFTIESDKQYFKADDTTMGVYTIQDGDVYDGYLGKYVHVCYSDRYEIYTDDNLYLPGDTIQLKGEMYKTYDDVCFAGWDVIYHESPTTCEEMMTYTIELSELKALGCDDMVTFYSRYMPKISDINGEEVDRNPKCSFTIGDAEDIAYHIGALDYDTLKECDPSQAVEVYLDKNGNGNFESGEKLTYENEFIVTRGSVVVTIRKNVLNTLSSGEHDIKIEITDMSLNTYTFNSALEVTKKVEESVYRVVNTCTK